MVAIEIQNLCKKFRDKKGKTVEALRDLSLSIQCGEVFGFLGPNGAGKSTTIKVLMGLIRPSSGSASILGQDIGAVSARKKVGYLPENPAFFDYLSAEEYLRYTGSVFRMDISRLADQTEELLKKLDLWEARKRPMRAYSKGMVQRVGLAQALLHDPDLFILDEPMSGLDPIGRSLVKEIILDLKRREKSVFFSTHITSDVESVCDRVGIIVKGEMRCVKKVDEIAVGGVTGYEVRYLKVGSDETETINVKTDDLSQKLSVLQSNGDRVLVIEPIRKNLEEFFVDIVRITAVPQIN